MNSVPDQQESISFAEGSHPTATWFKSLAFFLLIDAQSNDFVPKTRDICDWIQRYDEWFKHLMVADPSKLGLSYHREVSISDRVPLAMADKLIEIGLVSKSIGLGFSISVDLDDPDIDNIFDVLDSGALTGLGILVPLPVVMGTWTAEERKRWLEKLKGIFSRQILVGLIGSVASLRDMGVLSLESVNASNVTIYPFDLDWLTRDNKISYSKSGGCFSRFRVFVDPDGMIYPCVGFLTAEMGALGSIYEPIESTVFGGAPCKFDLSDLAREGPKNHQLPTVRRAANLPLICERHLTYINSIPLK